jgi:hypothetical protein
MSSNGANGTPKTTAPPPSSALERKWLPPLLLGLFIVTTIYFFEGESAEIVPQNVTFKNVTTSNLAPTSSKPVPKPDPTTNIRGKAKSKARPVQFEKMLEAFEGKRQDLYKQLEKDYGPETFKSLLLDYGRKGISPPRNSKNKESTGRMRRKMMLKILEGQADLAGFPTYVWATGGHRYVVSK